MLGDSEGGACILTLVERKSGYALTGKLARRTTANVNARAARLICAQPRPVRTITADNGTQFQGDRALKALVGTRI